MAGYRPEYTSAEEVKIVNFIIQKRYIPLIKGDKMWKEMAAEKIVNRTWQSLKQHFRKVMIKELHLRHYNLDRETINWFKREFNKEPKWGKKKKRSSEVLQITEEEEQEEDMLTKRRARETDGEGKSGGNMSI